MPKTIKMDIYNSRGKKQKDLLYQSKGIRGKDSYREMMKFLKTLGKLVGASGRGKTRRGDRRLLSRPSAVFQQRCVVKLRYGTNIASHKKFLEEYLPQKNKAKVEEKPELFNSEGILDDNEIEAYKSAMTGKHFKFIISPESQDVDIAVLTKTLVKRVEVLTGYQFCWMAAVHTDTGHNHAHLLINGRDKKNKDVHFDRLFLTTTVREMTQEICTAMVGKRTPQQIKESIETAYLRNRYTVLDETIKELETPVDDEVFGSRVTTNTPLLLKRLHYLSTLNLAAREQERKNTFNLEKGWKSKLKAIGRYNSFLNARNSLNAVSNVNLELFGKDTGPVEGVITKLYRMNDEDSWNHAALVENSKQNKAWYIRLNFEPDEKLLGARVKCGLKVNARGNMSPKITVTKWSDTKVSRS